MPTTTEFFVPVYAADGREMSSIGPLYADVDIDDEGNIVAVDDVFTEQPIKGNPHMFNRASLSRNDVLWPMIEQHLMSAEPSEVLAEDDLPDGVDDAREHGFGKFEYGLS